MTSTMGEATKTGARGRGDGLSVSSLEPPTRRRPSWVALGALLVGLAGLLGAYVFSAVSDTLSVAVAAHDIAPGEVIGPDDIRIVEMGRTADLRAVQSHQQDLIVGRAARGPIPEGTVLNAGLFVDSADVVPAGKVVVGASFAAGAVPTRSLRAGDAVGLIVVVDGSPSSVGAATQPTPDLGSGTVWAVESEASPQSGTDRTWVSLVIDEANARAVSQAAADETLRLVLLGSS